MFKRKGRNLLFPILFLEEQCGNNNETALSVIKCVWTTQGGKFSESERGSEQNGGTIFTFGTIDDAVKILDILGISKFLNPVTAELFRTERVTQVKFLCMFSSALFTV